MIKNNLFFWTGEEDFLISEKKEMWEGAFCKKHGGNINIAILDAKELSAGEIISDFETVPFLAEKRLVFIKNLPPKANEKMDVKKLESVLMALKNISDTTVLVFIQNKPDKRTSFYKQLIKMAQVEEFKELRPQELETWLKTYIKKRDAEILPSALSFFLNRAGTNLWKLSQEANKLIAYNNKKKAIS
ncbi:DNA polymerase III subunit delta, partial [Candidatus Peregrinibacteria bacterium]|nr:DNA polymerase III subunit delta [Candidatus Peregrinibacteria bacterium]